MHSVSLVYFVNCTALVISVRLILHLLLVASSLIQLKITWISTLCYITVIAHCLMRIYHSVTNVDTLHSIEVIQILVFFWCEFLVYWSCLIEFAVGWYPFSLD